MQRDILPQLLPGQIRVVQKVSAVSLPRNSWDRLSGNRYRNEELPDSGERSPKASEDASRHKRKMSLDCLRWEDVKIADLDAKRIGTVSQANARKAAHAADKDYALLATRYRACHLVVVHKCVVTKEFALACKSCRA